MRLIGITGGVGMGKTASTDWLRRQDFSISDTDTIAREIVEPGQPALLEVKKAFGSDLVDTKGRLRRNQLARIVFSSETARKQLEAILHPKIRERWMAEAESWRRAGESLGFIVIPLLFETQAEVLFDAVICVACSASTQQVRLRQRGWSDEEIEQRRAAQWSVERKIEKSDYVVWTDTSLEVHAAQLQKILG
jgi:dephospho-CoA kinase